MRTYWALSIERDEADNINFDHVINLFINL